MFLNNSPQDLRTTFWQRDLYDCGQIRYIPSRIVSLNPASIGECCHGELFGMINGEERRRFAATSPRPHSEESHQDCFAALLLSEVGRIWDSAFLLVRKMRVPHPLVGTLNCLVQSLQNALDSRRVRRTL